jgi:hypothetical protein
MFLKDLYHYSKAMFVAFTVFILAFVVINYKWGAVATPVLQYGMFSGVFHTKDTQTVYIVEANHELINNGKISFTNRDIIQVYIDNYQRYKEVNLSAYNTMKKYIGYAGLSSFMNTDKFTPLISDTTFTTWYRSKMEAIAGEQITTLNVYQQHFVWHDTALVAIDAPSKLTCIVP